MIEYIFIFSVFCSSISLFVLPAKYLYLVYFHIVSVCVVLLSYWTNVQTLKVLSGKYENFKMDVFDEVLTWDVDGIVHLFSQLQIVDFLFIVCRNILLQFCLSLMFNFLQMFTTNHSVNKVSSLIFTNVYLCLIENCRTRYLLIYVCFF